MNTPNKTPHVHAELIKAWADGAQIQIYNEAMNGWIDIGNRGNIIYWCNGDQFRIKPEPKPDVVRYSWLSPSGTSGTNSLHYVGQDNIKHVYDGETGRLKSVFMI